MGNITLENNSRKYQRNIKGRYLQQRKKQDHLKPSPRLQVLHKNQRSAFSSARAENFFFFERSK